MSLGEVPYSVRLHAQMGDGGGDSLCSEGPCLVDSLYSEVQCIMNNGHMDPPDKVMDTHN